MPPTRIAFLRFARLELNARSADAAFARRWWNGRFTRKDRSTTKSRSCAANIRSPNAFWRAIKNESTLPAASGPSSNSSILANIASWKSARREIVALESCRKLLESAPRGYDSGHIIAPPKTLSPRCCHVATPALAAPRVGLLLAVSHAAELTVEKDDEGVAVKIDGQLSTRYVTQSNTKPILWPIIGPNGKEITRQFPMGEALATEKADHPHQRSLWFTHGDVNGTSFWHENEGAGTIKHREFTKIEGGERPTIQTTNDWLKPDGEKVCEDVRTFTFGADADQRWIDLEVTVTCRPIKK